MKRRDLWIVLCIFLFAATLFLLSGRNILPTARPLPMLSPQTSTPVNMHAAATPSPTMIPAECYLWVTVGDMVFEPYPLLEERDFPIKQVDGKQNVVHITPHGFYMASATCKNQECVHQGEVTLKNRDVRILGNQVICLPNQVLLELLTPEEAQVVWDNARRNEK